MNKTKIEWCDYTWNPVTGCKHGCEYCYAAKISKRFTGDFEPRFHTKRLLEPLKVKKPSKIFVVSMGDLFGDWVPSDWISQVINTCRMTPWHTYMFLTKNESRYFEFDFPDNCWLGATTGDKPNDKTVWQPDGKSFLASDIHCTTDTMRFFNNSFLSLEPLRCDAGKELDIDGIDWIIIGAQTGPGAVKPKPDWVQSIIDQCRACSVPVFLKDNLNWPEKIQEWPERLNDA